MDAPASGIVQNPGSISISPGCPGEVVIPTLERENDLKSRIEYLPGSQLFTQPSCILTVITEMGVSIRLLCLAGGIGFVQTIGNLEI